MHNTIAVMNTKGGVGKSTIVLALAETLSAFHAKNVLIIDSDSQASASAMLMTTASLFKLQQDGQTIVDFLVKTVLNDEPDVEWPKFVVRDVSDIDDARSVYLIPSDMELTLLEREISRAGHHARLRSIIGKLLDDVRPVFDIVLIDCPPGLSVLTESWLREADFHLSPTKPDYVSVCGLEVFRRFKSMNPEMGFASNIGVLINMKDRLSATDNEYQRWLANNPDNRCFEQAIPRINALQDAARFSVEQRSYAAKYPGETGTALRSLAKEVLQRLADSAASADHSNQDPTLQNPPSPAIAKPAATQATPPSTQQPTMRPPGPPPPVPAPAVRPPVPTPGSVAAAAAAAAAAVSLSTRPAVAAPGATPLIPAPPLKAR